MPQIKELLKKNGISYINGDINDYCNLHQAFELYEPDVVVHFAGLKSVPQSFSEPLNYWENNVYGSICLFEVMRKFNCKNIVFSSSATVYGHPKSIPILENFETKPINPYGQTKLEVCLLYTSDAADE